MTVVYFDSSALVKLLVDEPGSDLAAALWDSCDAAVSSRLAYPEVSAALAMAGRTGRLDAAGQNRAAMAWEEYWSSTRVVEVSEPICQRAGELAGAHALRGADAVHLASVLALGTGEIVFAVWDERLRNGAQAAAARVVPGEHPSAD